MKMCSRRNVSQRWVMATMGMAGLAMAFMMRACLSITLTQMVRPVFDSDDGPIVRLNYCPMPVKQQRHQHRPSLSSQVPLTEKNVSSPNTLLPSYSTSPPVEDEWDRDQWDRDRFDWDERTQGQVLSAFYYGYIFTHIPGGLLSQRFGGKHTMGLGILTTAVFTLITPSVAYMGSTQLTVLRFVEGLGEGTTFPALYALLAQWAPKEEKGKFTTFVFAGVQVGNIFANFLSGFIIEYVPGGWPNVFYFFGAVSVVWFVLWCKLVYNDPQSHPFISDEERDYLKRSIGNLERNKDLAPTPWKIILTSSPVWALIIVEIGHDWGGFTISSELPKYMSDVLHFPVAENGLLSSIPFLARWITSIAASILADRIVKKRTMSVTAARKLFVLIGTIGPGMGVMSASFVGCNKFLATTCFALGMALMGFCYPSICINSLDLSPNYSPIIMGLVNGIGCLSGMATPYVAGILTPNRTILEWRLVFWIVMIMMVGTAMVFLLFGSGEIQPWDSMEQYNMRKKEKGKKNLSMDNRTITKQVTMMEEGYKVTNLMGSTLFIKIIQRIFTGISSTISVLFMYIIYYVTNILLCQLWLYRCSNCRKKVVSRTWSYSLFMILLFVTKFRSFVLIQFLPIIKNKIIVISSFAVCSQNVLFCTQNLDDKYRQIHSGR